MTLSKDELTPACPCFDGFKSLFVMSSGKCRMPTERLVPALFNRFGKALKGKRVVEILPMLVYKPKFAERKYDSVWVVDVDGADPYAIGRHANKMAALDVLLPARDEKLSYYSTFRKSHLGCACLLIKLGVVKWPGTDNFITAPDANPGLQEVLDSGLVCQVGPCAVVATKLEAFKVLMASDNCVGDEQMPEDDAWIIVRMKELADTASSVLYQSAFSFDQHVLSSVKQCFGTTWSDKELMPS